jgi:hypothetical protein
VHRAVGEAEGFGGLFVGGEQGEAVADPAKGGVAGAEVLVRLSLEAGEARGGIGDPLALAADPGGVGVGEGAELLAELGAGGLRELLHVEGEGGEQRIVVCVAMGLLGDLVGGDDGGADEVGVGRIGGVDLGVDADGVADREFPAIAVEHVHHPQIGIEVDAGGGLRPGGW